MSATNRNLKNDSLRFIQNKDGSYSAEWDKDDPNWKWMNDLTSKEIQIIVNQAVKEFQNEQKI